MANVRKRRVEEMAAAKGYYVDAGGSAFGPNGLVRQWIDAQGYFRVGFAAKLCFKPHRMQAFQMYGPAIYERGVVVRHLNGDKLDNSAGNIAIGTQSDNAFDRPRADRLASARRAAVRNQRLSDDDIARMRAMRVDGAKVDDLARAFGVSTTWVRRVCAYKQRQVSAAP